MASKEANTDPDAWDTKEWKGTDKKYGDLVITPSDYAMHKALSLHVT
jgi:hypothetical protein